MYWWKVSPYSDFTSLHSEKEKKKNSYFELFTKLLNLKLGMLFPSRANYNLGASES